MKRINVISLIAVLALALLLSGCAASGGETAADTPEPAADSGAALLPADGSTLIDLDDPEALAWLLDRDGAVTLTVPGTYRLTGSRQSPVVVDADGPVELILDGVSLMNAGCLQIRSGDAVTVTTAPGSENTIFCMDSEAVSSRAPLTFGGEGILNILSGYDTAVHAKAEVAVIGGDMLVCAADDGVKSQGTLAVSGGTITVVAGGDGLQADAGRLTDGDIVISGGSLAVRTTGNGLDAEGAVSVLGGSVSIHAADDGVKAAEIDVSDGSLAVVTTDTESADAEAPDDAETTAEEDAETLLYAGDGLQADAISVSGGYLSVTSADDALRAGTLEITGGTIVIDSDGDGLQADTLLTVEDGVLDITTGGGGGNAINHAGESFGPWSRSAAAADEASTKGIKCEGDITISGGTITLSTADDAIHCGVLCTIEAGGITICSSDDAIHSDDMLVICGGDINIEDCFEALEAYAVEIHGGDIVLRAVNDGINANGPEGWFGWGQSRETETASLSGSSISYVRMTGGRVDLVVTGSMSNQGDGIDSNGAVYVDGGELIVSTFGTFMENGIDTGAGGPVVTGGIVLAGGSSTMQEGWSSSSTQCCASLPTGTQAGGTEVVLIDNDTGEVLYSAVMADTFSSLLISHPAMMAGKTYTVTYGSGSSTLDFTTSNVVNLSGGWGFGFPGLR